WVPSFLFNHTKGNQIALAAQGQGAVETAAASAAYDRALVGEVITEEELWACTSCNACTQACPVNIDPLSIIVDLRRYLVMEQSAAPNELNMMMTNVENNGAPWQFNNADRLNWAND
ncbi:4Fe-4S dicluster domain-containing protein, partial [Empedobacter sp. UBA7494]|uniref:4Fe-4S dicluster domain-containing protein n=1 Tax=Empedobacter sp. UBA7494 TaxID=1946450 RepID=UPI0025C23B38